MSHNKLPFLMIPVLEHANSSAYSITTVLYYFVLYLIIVFSSGYLVFPRGNCCLMALECCLINSMNYCDFRVTATAMHLIYLFINFI